MPSIGGELAEGRHPSARIREEQFANFLTASLSNEIRHLTVGRQHALGRAQAHRRDGQLVPASLCQDMAENDRRLRRALERYTALVACG
jgi:translation initiation factor 6 (eIF-6)